MEELLYYIEVLKDIEDFVIRVNSDAGAREYRNPVFEDALTELVVDLKEEFGEW